jgi:hypothetical protein
MVLKGLMEGGRLIEESKTSMRPLNRLQPAVDSKHTSASDHQENRGVHGEIGTGACIEEANTDGVCGTERSEDRFCTAQSAQLLGKFLLL